MPEWYGVAGSKFNVVFDNESVRNSFDLFVPFFASSYFKCILSNPKIGYRRSNNIMIDSHLIEKERFTDISYFGVPRSEVVYQICIVKIDFFHFTQSAYPPGIITELGD